MVHSLTFVLASQSPARLQLLQTVGIWPQVQPSYFDESSIVCDRPTALVEQLALGKARAVAQNYPQPALILGCDSVLYLGGKIYGKPDNPADAIARWQEMRGQTGHLYTGHALIDRYRDRSVVRTQVTAVDFAPLSDRQIAAYVSTGEPLACAGCFALDGKGGLFVDAIRGCHSNVIGLSLPLLRQMLAELSYDVTDFWAAATSASP